MNDYIPEIAEKVHDKVHPHCDGDPDCPTMIENWLWTAVDADTLTLADVDDLVSQWNGWNGEALEAHYCLKNDPVKRVAELVAKELERRGKIEKEWLPSADDVYFWIMNGDTYGQGITEEHVKSLADEWEQYEGYDPDSGKQDPYDVVEGEPDFWHPGGESALRAGVREFPCPTCGKPNRLTAADVKLHYQCDECAEALEGRPVNHSEY